MKTFKAIITISLLLFIYLSQTSCVYRTTVVKKDNGKHKGWFKNPNNPHHPNSTNPGNAKGKSKGKGKK